MERKWGLDLVRATAAILVFTAHLPIWEVIGRSARLSTNIVASNIGFLGVQLFFALSGYLIGGVLLRQQPNNIGGMGAFWLRRLLRTMPLFILVLTVLMYFHGGRWDSYLIYLFQLAWAPGYLNFSENGFFIVSWSLAVEEWYYLFIPPLFCFFAFRQKINPCWVALAIVILLTGLRYHTIDLAPDKLVRYVTPVHLDTIAWGLLAATLTLSRRQRRYGAIVGIVLIVVSLVWRFISYYGWEEAALCQLRPLREFNFWGYIFISAGGSLILPWVARLGVVPRPWSIRVTKIAMISYPIYLVHENVIYRINSIFPTTDSSGFVVYIYLLLQIMLCVLATIILAKLLHAWVERPFIRLGRSVAGSYNHPTLVSSKVR